MPKILLLGYDYADDIAALSTGAASLCDGFCKKNFAIGLENLPFNTDLDEQLDEFEKRIHQIKTLTQQTFHLSWEQLIQEYSPTSQTYSVKAVKPLIPRAKTLHFQHAILNTLQHHPTTPFFGLGNNPNASSVLDCLSNHKIEWATLFISKENFIQMKKDLSSFKVPLEASFLFSAHYPPSEEIADELKQAHITSTSITTLYLPSSITAFIQQVGKSLDEKERLSVSMKALGKKHAPRPLHPKNMFSTDTDTAEPYTETASESSKSTPLSIKMKSTLKEFRGLFNNGNTSSISTPTIVGNKRSQDDD